MLNVLFVFGTIILLTESFSKFHSLTKVSSLSGIKSCVTLSVSRSSESSNTLVTKQISKVFGIVFASVAFSGIISNFQSLNSEFSSPLSFIVQPANAEFRAAQKRTYFRFTPKVYKIIISTTYSIFNRISLFLISSALVATFIKQN
jgi:NAD/NADP transhydrogenase beta subunit